MTEVPRYQRLADEFATAIASGRLTAGSAMPSLREVAKLRGLSLNTVTTAYRQLETRGLVVSHPRSGYRVNGSLPVPVRPLRATPGGPTGRRQLDLMEEILEAQASEGMLDLALAAPRGKRFYPADRLARDTIDVLRKPERVSSRYALPPGSTLLRERIARRMIETGMRLDPDDVVLAHGATEALVLALRAVTRPGDAVGIEAPTYFTLYPMLKALHLRAIEIPTHPQDGLDLDALERLLDAKELAVVVAMPTVQNPLGCTMPVESKRRLAALAARHRVPVIEDMVYAELTFRSPVPASVRSFDRDGWVLVCSSFSKTLAPDYRIGWIDAGRFTAAVKRLKFTSSGSESRVLCEAVASFLEDGYAAHVRSLRRLYATQVDAVRALVAEHFPRGTRATEPSGGFLVWVELPEGIDSSELFRRALAHRIVVLPGQVYSQGARYRSCLRLTCCIELDDRVVAAIAKVGQLACELAP